MQQRSHRGLHLLRSATGWAVPQEVLKEKILPQIPLGRLGQPDEIAALVAFICSDAAAFMTGSNVAMNGGQHMY